MIDGARQLPSLHLSVRVPWHDGRWAGTVCSNPRGNTSCLVLPRIAQTRDDDDETSMAGSAWDKDGVSLPACAAERGAFMASFGYDRWVEHPYSKRSDADGQRYAHFRRTRFHHARHAAAVVPFGWMLKEKDGLPAKAEAYQLGFRPELEPDLSFTTRWVQERRNQLVMLDSFFGAIEPEESLVLCYAKQTPLVDDGRRVIVGLGRVLKIDPPVEYSYAPDAPADAMRCMVWERNVHHSIRAEIGDGFLLPYHHLVAQSAEDPTLDLASFALRAPDEAWSAFSMGAEHVSHDQAITVLLACATLLERWEKLVDGKWSVARSWLDARLNRIWRLRGGFPGLGSALTALGLPNGTLIAHAVGQRLHADGTSEMRDPWPLVEQVLQEPKLLPPDMARMIGPATAKMWGSLKPERKALLQLLARFELTADQATRWFVSEERAMAGIDLTDRDILANPYLCYEADRGRPDAISATTIDRGLFADGAIATILPVPEPSACAEPVDQRRLRALAMTTLDGAALEGHTLLPQTDLVQRIRSLPVVPPCPASSDWIAAFADFIGQRLVPVEMADGTPARQLDDYARARELIARQVRRRLSGRPHSGKYDWRALIDQRLPRFTAVPDQEIEELARQEKALALETLYRSRFSVLIGPAGTGKTSLLSALIALPEIESGGVLLLAPTGKARVQMQRRTEKAEARTLAQFLLALGRYDPMARGYMVTGAANRERGYKTVIVDEASMLTEDQLAATLDAIETTAVERLILVGDPRQLPPIGAGRPFVDIARFLVDSVADVGGVAKGHAELTIIRRQTEQQSTGVSRDDVILARWFGGGASDPGADEVWQRLATDEAAGIRAVGWTDESDLQDKLLAELSPVLHMLAGAHGAEATTDEQLFEISLGGRLFRDRVYFNPSRAPEDGADDTSRRGGSADVESWQILSPLRGGETGVDGLNRWLKKQFRKSARTWFETDKPWHRKIPKPMGPQEIIYGDKVINVVNHRRHRNVWPPDDRAYLANGEIGLVIGQYKGKNTSYKGLPWQIEVEFSSQLGVKYGFGARDFGDEQEPPLDLAYALTIHKSQGSEFGVTFVVVPNPCRLLSRELLYTALTRQRQRVVLLHQGDVRDLIKLSSADKSVTAQRLTNLFAAPRPVEQSGLLLEEGLVHRTARGELVRSKSEVIIANLLHSLDVPYAYEQAFTGGDGTVRYPDFTVDDAASGRRVFIEHLGMLSNPDYRRRWKAKLAWYRLQDVLPIDEGEGEAGSLLTTSEEKGFDSAEIEKKLRQIF